MTQSMTAFARMQAQFDATTLCWEIKSVNHRYLDVSFRMPEEWRFLETELRAAIRGEFSRGKLECQLKSSGQITANQAIVVNEELINSVLSLSNKLAISTKLQNDMTLSSLLNWPGVVTATQPDVEQFAEHVLKLFKGTLTQLQLARTSEGEALNAHVQNRLQRLQEEIVKAKSLVAHYASQTRDKLLARFHALQLAVDNTRVEQEIALLLTRMDVSEELDRLQMHCTEVAKVLASADSTGRRLDFLMQELNREANTLSSKSDTVALTQSAVEMKVLIEQMREQIQNIE
ncbi:MAG: YicC/YloC family endoribonuclease [Legionella sp.]|nr:YicC/YloC family endoribonuclease [Legionella sp.]